MRNLTRIRHFRSEYSENILPTTALFKYEPTVNITTGTMSIEYSNELFFEGGKSLLLQPTSYNSENISFNFGSALVTTIENTGSHIFSFRLLNHNTTNISFVPFTMYVKLWVNSVNVETFIFQSSWDEVNDSKKWITWAQSYNFTIGDVVDFSFEIEEDNTYPFNIISFYLDAFKLELDDRFLEIPSIYSKPKDYDISNDKVLISETQWDVTDIGTNVIANGASINLLTLINNATDKNLTNSDTFDQLNIVSNSIRTTYRNCKSIHVIRLSLNITSGSDQYYQLQIRRTIDDSVVYRALLQRNADETIQTVEMTTRTLSALDPFVVDGFYLAFVNNSGASATIDDALSLVIISNYQKAQKV